MQLAFIIAFCASLSSIYEQREMFGNHVKIEPCQYASFMRAVIVQYGLVQHMFRFN